MLGRRVVWLLTAVCVLLALLQGGQVARVGAQQSLHPDWMVKSQIASNVTINDVTFVDSLNGWAAGNGGAIYVTHNGGQTWSFQVTRVTDDLERIMFTDAQHGFAVGGQTLLLSTDGGQSWRPSATASGGSFLSDVSSPTMGIIYVASHDQYNDYVHGIYVSTDGGQTWQSIPNAPTPVSRLVFLDANHGYLLSGGDLYETTDAGTNWSDIYAGHYTRFSFPTSSVAYLGGSSGSVSRTTNGGSTFTDVSIPSTADIASLAFISSTQGLATTGGDIFGTQDAGSTWQNQTLPLNTAAIAVVGYRGATPFAVTTDGSFLYYNPTSLPTGTPTAASSTPMATTSATSTVAATGTSTPTPSVPTSTGTMPSGSVTPTMTVSAQPSVSPTTIASGTGTIVPTVTSTPTPSATFRPTLTATPLPIATSTSTPVPTRTATATSAPPTVTPAPLDRAWVVESNIGSSEYKYINDTTFIDARNGWAVGNGGVIYVTHDGGQTWSFELSGTTDNLQRIMFTDAQHGFAVGGQTLLLSTDGGQSWHPSATAPGGAALNDVSSPAAGTIYVANGDDGYDIQPGIYVSTNGGQSWQPIPNSPTGASRLVFLDANHGYLLARGDLYETTDAGVDWTDLFNRHYGNFYTLAFPSATTFYLGGSSGNIVRTTDGAQSFSIVSLPASDNLNNLAFVSTMQGLATTGGHIYGTQTGGTAWQDETLPLNLGTVATVGYRGGEPYAVTYDGDFLHYGALPTTPTPTATNTSTPSPTNSPTNTPTATNTPSPTNTPTATNTPTPIPTAVPANTPVSPARANTPAPPVIAPTARPISPTMAPTARPLPPTTTATIPSFSVPPRPTSAPSRLHPRRTPGLKIDLKSKSVLSGSTVRIGIHTDGNARVYIALRVVSTRVVFVTRGKHRTRHIQSVTLYEVRSAGQAGKRGLFAGSVYVSYHTVHAVQATLTVSVYTNDGKATQTTPVTIKPPLRLPRRGTVAHKH